MTAPATPPRPNPRPGARANALEDRLIRFAIGVSEAARQIKRSALPSNVGPQLERSGTSPAAAYAEARGAESAKDYVHKMQICEKELRETLVWLKIASGLKLTASDFPALQQECNELIAIAVTCIKKAKMQ